MKDPRIQIIPPKKVKLRTHDHLPRLEMVVQHVAKDQQRSIRHFSDVIGLSPTSLGRILRRRDPSISLLIGLSEALGHNLLDMYLQLLPEHLRDTQQTHQMQQQLDDMAAQMDALRAELDTAKQHCDIYREMVQKRI